MHAHTHGVACVGDARAEDARGSSAPKRGGSAPGPAPLFLLIPPHPTWDLQYLECPSKVTRPGTPRHKKAKSIWGPESLRSH